MIKLFRYAPIMLLGIISSIPAAFGADNVTVKTLTFPENVTLEEKVALAADLVPSQKQLEWQKLGMTAFLHFGVNTFTSREWGDGSESPEIFNPRELDAEQWVKVLKDAGFKLVILTAKHHDGFCLWPTATTTHSVASSPWKNGKGDVMAELRKACDKYGMKLGVYLSPWDRNAECYGDSPRYDDMFVAQLTELLTKYGKIDEVWFDGACGEGPNGKKQVYDWDRYKKVIETLQPDAVMAIMGDDVRWVGNEKGLGRETEWSATALTPGIYPGSAESNNEIGIFAKAPDLGGREIIAKAKKLYWWPSEVDVSIRPGWFYHQQEAPKPLRQLAEIYLNSVGRNSVLLLNVPPDTRGLIADADVERLGELKAWIDKNFSTNLATPYTGGSVGVAGNINTVVLGEDITKGQRVEKFIVEGFTDGAWSPVAEGTTIGFKRILTFPDLAADSLRITVLSSRKQPNITTFEAYNIELPVEINVELPGYRIVPATDWSVVSATGPICDVYKVFDDTEFSYWQSPSVEGPKSFTIDMKRTVPVAGFVYEPRGGDDKSGTVYHYALELSDDGKNWQPAKLSGEFSNIMHNPIPQMVYFPSTVAARYIRFTAIDEIDGNPFVTVGEFKVLTPEKALEPVDDESLVWKNASAPLGLKAGQAHPKIKGWKFYTAYEFNSPADTATIGIPAGWMKNPGKHVSRCARIDDDCFITRGGYLRMESHKLGKPVDNGYGNKVNHSTYSLRTVPADNPAFWTDFTDNMRVEVRARRSSHTGLNDALWFMGNNKRKWPAKGEIDLMENPKADVNNTSHFTLHSENHYAGKMGAGGSITANTELADMTDWNIYWIEWLPDEIRGGVNGQTYFVHHKGDNGNNDWPWSDPEQFYMLMSSCLSTDAEAWPGAVDSESWDMYNPPHFDIDWIRVFVNDDFAGSAPERKYY